MRVARWLLLVMLAVGVCGMHTLGHLSTGHGRGSPAGHGQPADHDRNPAPPFPSNATSVVGAGLAEAVVDAGGEVPGFDPGAVCLAVLTSMLLLLLAAVWAGTRVWPQRVVRVSWQVSGVARAPPRLAELSVMRL